VSFNIFFCGLIGLATPVTLRTDCITDGTKFRAITDPAGMRWTPP
jgi:hypothetical protein